jgi:hypothetical protein
VRIDADKVLALKVQIEAQRLEIRVADERGGEHVLSLPVPAAVELAEFISDACEFLERLTRGGRRDSPEKD